MKNKLLTTHLILTFVWAAQFAGALFSLWYGMTHHIDFEKLFLLSVGYISLCSIYANGATHAGAYQAARAEVKAKEAADG